MNKRSRQSSKGKGVLKRIMLIVLAVILVLVGVVAVIASINVKAMNRSVDVAMAELCDQYTVTPVDAGEYGLDADGDLRHYAPGS